jgi:hypothetical protein
LKSFSNLPKAKVKHMTQRNHISGHPADHCNKQRHGDIAKNHALCFATHFHTIGFQNATVKSLPDKQHHFKLEPHRLSPICVAPILFAPIVAALVFAEPIPQQHSQRQLSNPLAPPVVTTNTT